MTTPDQLREIVDYLQNRVNLVRADDRTIAFEPPTSAEMTAGGLDAATVNRLLAVPWWQEMIDDIIDTPDFAEPEASEEVVLGYARDVIREFIGKQFPIDG